MSKLFYTFIFSLSLIALTPGLHGADANPQLWYFHHSYLTSQYAVTASENLIDRAAVAGYTGLVLWDSAIDAVQLPGWPSTYLEQVASYSQSKGLAVVPLCAPFGYSNDVTNQNVNVAEGIPVIGARYLVSPDGTQLTLRGTASNFQNPGFEGGQLDWFSYNDAGVSVDTTTSHSGNASALISYPPGNGRLFQTVPVTPWRHYHIQFWVKTDSAYWGWPNFYVFDHSNWNITRLNMPIPTPSQGASDWTEVNYAFDSEASTSVDVLFGTWNQTGRMWFDDMLFQESGLVYVVRGESTPLKIYNPKYPALTFQEGTDVNPIFDARMVATKDFSQSWHRPTPVTIPKGSHLVPNQEVAMDFYIVQPMPGAQVGMSLQDPGTLSWLAANSQAVAQVFQNAAGVMLGYDEMRQMGTDAMAQASNQTAGQLLAASVKRTASLYGTAMRGKPVYVWSDMFDPYHNAVDNYYTVPTTIAGSWLGLDSSIRIFNWNLNNLTNSLTWFSGLNNAQPTPHQQIVAGFYDAPDAAAEAKKEFAAAAGIPGVTGAMYTTWGDNYSQLQQYADAVRSAWTGYQASLQTH